VGLKNVTITLDEETARWARVEAARKDLSLSKFVASLLRERMNKEDAYDAAMRDYLSRDAFPLGRPGQPYPKRDELYDRGRLR
jgi:hypothetical protein